VITFTGPMRLYFNRHGAAPLVWCVASDGWELTVAALDVRAPILSCYAPKDVADEDDGKPSAWFSVDGVLIVQPNGRAIIKRTEDV
jgi:hypothetical protein